MILYPVSELHLRRRTDKTGHPESKSVKELLGGEVGLQPSKIG